MVPLVRNAAAVRPKMHPLRKSHFVWLSAFAAALFLAAVAPLKGGNATAASDGRTPVTRAAEEGTAHKTRNIIFVMTDGFRWQEFFDGADATLMNKKNGRVVDEEALKKAYWRDSPEDRRLALLPFVWTVMAKEGQIYGNRAKGSDAYVTNGMNFSYPGYNETFCGFPDARINSNNKFPNPNVTMFEWLNKRPSFHGEIAAFGAWDLFPYIFNVERSGLLVNAGYDPLTAISNPRIELLNQIKAESPREWDDEPFDVLTFQTALEYLKEKKPRVLYISLGETDDWAHEGNYEEYLRAGHRADMYLRVLWETVQSMPEYRGTTTLVFSPDHGRGKAEHGKWRDHGVKVPDSKFIWMAFLGPDTAPLGERSHIAAVTQSQIAATLAALLGENYNADVAKAGQPIADVLPH